MAIDFSVTKPSKGTQVSKLRADVQNIIKEHGIKGVLIRQTITKDTMGSVTAVTEKKYNIYVHIQDIMKNDRQIHDMGLAIPGNAKAFFFHEYDSDETGQDEAVTPQTDDIIHILETNDKWRVQQILEDNSMQYNTIYRTAIIRKLGLNEQ